MNEPKQKALEPSSDPRDREGLEEGVGAPEDGGEEKRSSKKRRNEPPVLVIEPQGGPASGNLPKLRTGQDSTAKNLESMVHDLLQKVREAEGQLKEKEEAIAQIRDQTVTMAQKLLLARESRPKGMEGEADESSPDRIALEALDFFTKAFHGGGSKEQASPSEVERRDTEKIARVQRDVRNPKAQKAFSTTHLIALSHGGRACPVCAHRLRKARCLNVLILVCLSCRGIFLDGKAVRQLARLLPWMQYVEQFLSKASRGANPTPKTSRTASLVKGQPAD